MIKKLINDIAYDNVSLTQGLTRAKLIQNKLRIDSLNTWINQELNGYEANAEVPSYRMLTVKIIGDFSGDFGQQWKNVPLVLDKVGENLGMDMYSFSEKSSIQNIEDAVKASKPGAELLLPFHPKMVRSLADMYRKQDPSAYLISAGRVVLPSQYGNILIQIKQRLLDILLDLDNKFPDLEDDLKPSLEAKEKASSIVNFHIHGGQNNTNLGVGGYVIQSGNNQKIKTELREFREALLDIGVPAEEVSKIEEIATSTEPKETKLQKAMQWVGRLSGKLVEKGIEHKLPEIIDLVQKGLEVSN